MLKSFVVLQCQPWREHDWLIDGFSRAGRQRLLLNRPQAAPDLFTLYQGDWPTQDLPTIKGWQPQKNWPLRDTALYCALYLNELIGLLLPEHEAQPALFQQYCTTLGALADGQLPDPWLRLFEGQLLQALGYGLQWQQDAQGQPINPQLSYQFVPRQGFVQVGLGQPGFNGADLLAIHQGSPNMLHWRMIRSIMRLALDDILPRPLISRTILNSLTSSQPRN